MSFWGSFNPPGGTPSDQELPHVPKLPWVLRATRLQVVLGTVVFGLVVFLVGVAWDWIAYHSGFAVLPMLALSDAATAVITALFAWVLLRRATERRRIVHERLRMVADLNHHIRNALEVIQLTAHSIRDEQAIAAINESITRISWALSEILGDGDSSGGDRATKTITKP